MVDPGRNGVAIHANGNRRNLTAKEDVTIDQHGSLHATNPDEMTERAHGYCAIRAGGTLIALEARKGMRPVLLYAGCDLRGVEPQELAVLSTQQHAPGSASVSMRPSLLNETGTGHSSPSGLLAHRQGKDWAIDLRVIDVVQTSPSEIAIHCKDANTGIAASHNLVLHSDTGMLVCSATIENTAKHDLEVEWCAALCLPFDARLTRFLSFTGKWAHEFAIEEVPEFQGSIVRENQSGRTSHNVSPGGILATPQTSENAGLAMGFHLAWSGNHRLRVDRNSDGLSQVQMGEMALPGEIRLVQGESYRTPDFLTCWSDQGLNAVSQTFHDYLTSEVLDPRSKTTPRPVHYNTWEAVYFNHDEATLLDLARAAADAGAERFVLDDGWFGSRRHDGAGLGDWWVSPEIYPNGLHTLADTVRDLGMEFGLWFEPEMVNPDSELYRSHPDWVLGIDGVDVVPFRRQLTLDLTKTDVFEYLFDRLNDLVGTYAIDYIKWDMNRDTTLPASAGRAAMHRQTQAVYRLISQLRAHHPTLEIESCSSGGARADFGIMRFAERIWPSDNNDARERQRIMRGASHFFPLRVLGNHVGPRRCHITGREFGMAFRAGSAMLGHMGMELDLRRESASDLETLKAGIALHKQHRDLIHSGQFLRLESSENTNLVGCVARDGSEAIFSYSMLETQLATLPQRIILSGLDPDRRYRVRLIWPQHNPSISAPSIVEAADLLGDGQIFSGAALMGHGMQPPLTFPDTCLIYHLETCE